MWASVSNSKGAYFDTLLVLALRNFSYTIKAAIHHGICVIRNVFLFTTGAALSCFAKGERHMRQSGEHEITHLAQNYPQLSEGGPHTG